MKEKNYPYFLDAYQDAPMGTPGTFPLRKSDIERLAKEQGIGGGAEVDPKQTEVTFTENGVNVIEPLQGFDGMSSVKVTVDVAGGGGDYSKWEIGDIVLYDNIEDKKVKSTKDDYNLDRFPLDRFTPIGVIAFVMEDGSARMVSLVYMSCDTPDTGDVTGQQIYWGCSSDITGLTNFTDVVKIDPTTGEVVGFRTKSYLPSIGDQYDGKLSLDGKRYYSSQSSDFLPSPYNADGTLNSEFTVSSLTYGPLYCWSRQKNSSTYYMYTDTETPSEETILWCGTRGNNSQVKNYGNTSKIGGVYEATRLGSILDESVFDGGVEAFVANFTAIPDSTYEETFLFANSDMDGKSNTSVILTHVTLENWQTIDKIPNSHYEQGYYPAACCCWRFHTVDTEQGDWYCPSAGELAMMMSNFGDIQSTLKSIKKTAQVPVALLSSHRGHLSSSESNESFSWKYSNEYLERWYKSNSDFVRALCHVPVLG